MEIKDAKGIPAKEILLSPFHMLHQVSTALLPGILVIFMMMLKHSPLIPSALSATSMLGYRTRICLALLIALVIGRVIQSIAFIFSKFCAVLAAKMKEMPVRKQSTAEGKKETEHTVPIEDAKVSGESNAQAKPEVLSPVVPPGEDGKSETEEKAADGNTNTSNKLTPEQETSRHFFTGILLGTVVAKDGSAFDSWEAQRAHIGLILGSGFVLLGSSIYTGDGLRLYELIGGLVLIVMGALQGRELSRVRIELLGNAVGQFIAAHTIEENIEILQAVGRVLPIIAKRINPTTAENEPVQIVAEIAEKSGQKAATVQNVRRKNRRHR
jgi:hypothetical protein